MITIAQRLATVHDRINTALIACGRPPGSVQLLAVSKGQPLAALRAALATGQRAFGESYLQEALMKQAELKDSPLHWHFIGPVQSNKTADIAAHFDWVHSIDRLKIAQRLSAQRPAHLADLNVCIQLNISAEPSKSGVTPEDLPSLVHRLSELPRLRLRGLMAIPAPTPVVHAQRRAFRAVRDCLESFQHQGYALDTLSMGMSEDLEAAIAEGATLIRVGTAIFGPR
ncbi:MAG: YggS family pyridoxal phosphate-dependent enzyme [Gammaproteobacteria bacterium]|nr:YggS family pyridoxal phosphate-dependent enzyme [Gammaproteobacteria bacterium]